MAKILTSFGYRDSDWVDPDESDYESEYTELDIDLKSEKFKMTPEGLLVCNDKELSSDLYDPDTDAFIVAGEELWEHIEDLVYNAIYDKFGDAVDDPHSYRLTGYVTICYYLDTPIVTPTMRLNHRKYDEDAFQATAEFDDAKISVSSLEMLQN